MIIAPDYDIPAALQAREDNDASWFHETLPTATLVNGPVSFPVPPPSQRGWKEFRYPPLPAVLIGEVAGDVLVPPKFPLEVRWHDDLPAAFVGAAPDSSTAIEIRYAPAHPSPQFVDAYIPILGSFGKRRVGVKLEVFTPNGFDWGSVSNGGKMAGGLWGGGRTSTGLQPPWNQNGVTVRNIWSVGGGSVLNTRLYAYNLNRGETDGNEGTKTANVTGLLETGQWQVLEYEGSMNSPGFANGFVRFWLDGTGVGAIENAVWALNNEWAWRGPIISDAWDGAQLAEQSRYIRNLTVYVPPGIDQSKQTKELVVFVWLNAVEAIITLPPEMVWKGGTTESPGSEMQWFGGTTNNPGEPMKWYGGEN